MKIIELITNNLGLLATIMTLAVIVISRITPTAKSLDILRAILSFLDRYLPDYKVAGGKFISETKPLENDNRKEKE